MSENTSALLRQVIAKRRQRAVIGNRLTPQATPNPDRPRTEAAALRLLLQQKREG